MSNTIGLIHSLMFMDGSGDMKTDVKLCLGKEFCDALKDRPLVVRCKDCKHWDKDHSEECENLDSVCFHNGLCKPDWFCADGERK